jgi:cell division protein ZapA
MAQISVSINGRSYPVTCNAGEEDRISQLARYVDDKVRGFARDLGQIGDARLLLLAALVLADELAEAHDGGGAPPRAGSNGTVKDEEALAAGVDNLARRIEAIAARLETAHI